MTTVEPHRGGRVYPLAPAFTGDDLLERTGLELAAMIVDGAITSGDLVDRCLTRIARHDPALSAFAAVVEGPARREAERADKLRARGRIVGPFHGVPTAVKDHHLLRFTRTRMGSRAFDWLWSPVDDRLVRSLRDAGFVLVGKTMMSELGILPIVETELQPPTRNPWNISRTAGGSSGGAGAAIAAGFVPLAPGSDGAGSVRIPASLNGLVGLKPTRGLIPDDAARIDRYGFSSIGPLARSIDDAAALLDLLAAPGRGHHRRRSREALPPLRVGVIVDGPIVQVDPRIAALVEGAADRLRAAGHAVERRASPAAALGDFLPIYQRFVSRIPILARGRLGPFARWFWESGRAVADADAERLLAGFVEIGRQMMEGLDVMLSPTVGISPFEVGAFARLPPAELFAAVAPLGAFTAMANITGQPALTLPAGLVDGMPVGVQLTGHRDDDARLFALARQIEAP
jgi:amidase